MNLKFDISFFCRTEKLKNPENMKCWRRGGVSLFISFALYFGWVNLSKKELFQNGKGQI